MVTCDYSSSGYNREVSQGSTSSRPKRPRPPLVHTPSHNNNSSSASSDGDWKVTEPSRAAPAPPHRPSQPAAYSVSTGVSILPTRAAPTPPAKPPQPPQPPAKPPKSGTVEQLDPRRLRPAVAVRPDASRPPPLPQKPPVS